MRIEYGNRLKWMIPFPGDWHILYNYLKVVMKVFADGGLKHLDTLSGHRAETLTSLLSCSNFKRTHRFLLQMYQAVYQYFLSQYTISKLESTKIEATIGELEQALEDLEESLQNLRNTLGGNSP